MEQQSGNLRQDFDLSAATGLLRGGRSPSGRLPVDKNHLLLKVLVFLAPAREQK